MIGQIVEDDIRIRQMMEEELELLLEWTNTPDVIPFWYGKELTLKELSDDWTTEYFMEDDDSGRCFIIEYREKPIGMINHNGKERDSSCEIDIVIGESTQWSKGLGSRVLKLFCNAIFREMDASKIFVVTSSTNPRAIRAYQKAGFILGEISDLNRPIDDPPEDTYLYMVSRG